MGDGVMQQEQKEDKTFFIPFQFSCYGIKKIKGKDYQDAVNRAESKVNSYNIDQNHLKVVTLDGSEYEFSVEECDLEYDREYEKEDINNQMGATI
jgi:hypothetical protein